MIKFAVFAIVIALPHTRQDTEPTVPVGDRIRLLKYNIEQQLKHIHTTEKVSLQPGENYEYVDVEKLPITPVQEHDKRAREGRYNLHQLKTKKTTLEDGFGRPTSQIFYSLILKQNRTDFGLAVLQLQCQGNAEECLFKLKEENTIQKSKSNTFVLHRNILRSKRNRNKKNFFEKPVDKFYRKVFRRNLYEEQKDTPLPWLHCQNMITPYLTGVKTEAEMGEGYVVDSDHRIVTRLIHLLTLNTTSMPKEDVSHILFQVDALEIRLFQWTPEAISNLFEAITNGEEHTFKKLIFGLRRIFREWHLDYHNVTSLLRETRIFRPMCIAEPSDQSSTKTTAGSRYAKFTTTTPQYSGDEDCNERKKFN